MILQIILLYILKSLLKVDTWTRRLRWLKMRAGSMRLPNFKMATEARGEARRRKLLQNPEDRLKKIIGSRSSHPATSHSQLETDENVLRSFKLARNESVDGEMELADTEPIGQENELMSREKEGFLDEKGLQFKDQAIELGSMEGNFKSKDLETERNVDERTRSLETDTCSDDLSDVRENTGASLPQSSVLSSSGVNRTVEQGRSSSGSNLWRVVFNVVLAFVLVGKWTYVNLDVLLATRTGDGQAPDSSHKLSVQSEVRKQNCRLISFYSTTPPPPPSDLSLGRDI